MDDQRRQQPDDEKRSAPEGVRIIGPDEAAEAIERGEIAERRGGDQPRYGDRPTPPPEGPRPSLRFPLDASADPTRIERPPVQPAPDPVTGPVEMPHWTDPPTGEVPAVLIGDDRPLIEDEGDDLDAWSSFATSTPRWRDADDDWGDEGFMEQLASDGDEVRVGAMGDQDSQPSHDEYFGFDDLEQRVGERTGDGQGPRFETGGDDWNATDSGSVEQTTGDETREDPAWMGGGAWADDDAEPSGELDDPTDPVMQDEDDDVGDHETRDDDVRDDDVSGGSDGPDGTDADDYYDDVATVAPPSGERDLVQAAMVGGGLAVLALVLLAFGAKFVVLLVALVLGASAVEYFGKLREVGWEAATLLGTATCVLFPLAVYWRGPAAAALVGFIAVVSVFAWYLVGAGGREPRVLEGSGATLFGVFWIGGLGSAAAALLRMPDGRALFLTAVLATVAYDIGGYFFGKAMGHRPLTSASPNKTMEGLAGGMGSAVLVTIIVVGVFGLGPWSSFGGYITLGIGAALAAPLGDLCQSLLKRDLGVKDMSTILPGHGGVLDRFDGMLFVLPTVFWLYTAFGPLAG